MRTTYWLAVLLLVCPWLPAPAARAGGWLFGEARLNRVNRRLHGQLIDYTHNHGADRRIWSAALGERRDLYVYLPPGFDPCKRYPLVIWLHGFAQDEQSFREDVVAQLDAAMACGKLVPCIVAAPDGSLDGHACLKTPGSFFINTPKGGRFEDFVMHDVWDFVTTQYPVRPEREAHVLAGASMGGGGAYNLSIKYRDRVGVVFGFFPPLNGRWVDCHGRYRANFDPCCWDWETRFRRWQIVGRFYGVVLVRWRDIIDPLYDRHEDFVAAIARDNPAEMLEAHDVQDGDLAMYVAYGGRDQFNLDAQVESFLFLAKQRGLCIGVGYDPRGKHDLKTALRLMPGLLEWLGPLLAPYGPCP